MRPDSNVEQLVTVWVLDGFGVVPSKNWMALWALVSGEGWLVCGAGDVPLWSTSLTKEQLRDADRHVVRQVEDLAKVLAETGREVVQKRIDIGSHDPALIAKAMKEHFLTMDVLLGIFDYGGGS